MKRMFILSFLVLMMIGCQVPGKMIFKRSGDRFECVEVQSDSNNITAEEIQRIENRLNGK